MLNRVCGSADEWIYEILICKMHYFLTCSVTAIALISRPTGILHIASEMLCSALFLPLLPCLVVRVKTSCSVSTVTFMLTMAYTCVFPHCNNRRIASIMLCNYIST